MALPVRLAAVVVREARQDDAAAVGEAHAEAWRVGFAGLFETGFLREAVIERRKLWVTSLADLPSGTQVLVAEIHQQVAGFVHIGRSADCPRIGELYAIYVHPDYWGTGAARSLLDEALQWLLADDVDDVVLWTHEGAARARRFYEKNGWLLTGRTAEHDFGDGRPSRHVEYAWGSQE